MTALIGLTIGLLISWLISRFFDRLELRQDRERIASLGLLTDRSGNCSLDLLSGKLGEDVVGPSERARHLAVTAEDLDRALHRIGSARRKQLPDALHDAFVDADP